jgi:hypothetical protein
MRKTGLLLLAPALLVACACLGSNSSQSQTSGKSSAASPTTVTGPANGPAVAGQAPPSSGAVQAAATPPTDGGAAGGPVAAAGLTVYSDYLAAKWEDWSWNTTVNLENPAPVYSGERSISATVKAPWGALYLHTDVPTDLTPFTYLRFAAQVTQAGQRYAVALVDTNNKLLANPFFLATFGDITAGAWKYYRIPLAELNATNKRIKGIVIQDGLGMPQPPLYIDDLGFQ